jgi:DnaJ-class molecular chaperone
MSKKVVIDFKNLSPMNKERLSKMYDVPSKLTEELVAMAGPAVLECNECSGLGFTIEVDDDGQEVQTSCPHCDGLGFKEVG